MRSGWPLVRQYGEAGIPLFGFLGADMITEVDHPAVTGGLTLSYGADGSAGLDGLGRVVDQKWTTGDGETLTVVDRFGYTYDLAGNRLTRDVGAAPFEQDLFDEKYAYDALNRLTNVERGRLYCGEVGHRLWVWHRLGLSQGQEPVFGCLLHGARRDGADGKRGTRLLRMESCA